MNRAQSVSELDEPQVLVQREARLGRTCREHARRAQVAERTTAHGSERLHALALMRRLRAWRCDLAARRRSCFALPPRAFLALPRSRFAR